MTTVPSFLICFGLQLNIFGFLTLSNLDLHFVYFVETKHQIKRVVLYHIYSSLPFSLHNRFDCCCKVWTNHFVVTIFVFIEAYMVLRSMFWWSPPKPATAAFAVSLASVASAGAPLTPVPLPHLGEGVLRNHPSTSGFPCLMTQNVILPADLRPQLTFSRTTPSEGAICYT